MRDTAQGNPGDYLLTQQEEVHLDLFQLQQILLEEQKQSVLCAEPGKENVNHKNPLLYVKAGIVANIHGFLQNEYAIGNE